MPNAPPSPAPRRSPDGYALLGERTMAACGNLVSLFIFSLRHKRQPMCSRLVCDSGVMNVTAVIRASAVSVLDIHENDGI